MFFSCIRIITKCSSPKKLLFNLISRSLSTDTKRRVLIKTFKVTYDESDMRLDRFLKYRIDQDKDFPVTRKGTIDKWIHQRRVKLLEPIAELSNGIEKDFSDLRKVGSKEMESEYSITTVSSSGTKTKTGQIWRVRALVEGDLSDNKDTSTSSQLENELPLRDWIVYMDKKIIVINKPEGIAVQGGTGIKVCVDTSLPALKYDYSDNPRIVHRLDKTTSGLLILARTRKSAQELSGRFRDGVIALTNTKEVKSIRKKYVAIVHSRQPIPFSDTDIDNFILRGDMVVTQEKNTQKIVMRQHERSTFDESSTIKTIWSSMTEARVASSAVVDGEYYSLLSLYPRTGRKHQLRVHCAQMLKAPILGDTKYDIAETIKSETLSRIYLHLEELVLADWHDDISNSMTETIVTKGCTIQDDGSLFLKAPIPLYMQDQMNRLRLRSLPKHSLKK